MSTRLVTPSVPSMRVGDPERGHTAARLGQAFAQGYLSMEEYEARLGRAFGAETVGALHDLLVDLPLERIGRRDPQRRAARHDAARRVVRLHLAAYVAVSMLMIGIWLATAVAVGAWYFWPAWPILGWGIGIVSHAIPVGACGRRASRAADPVVSAFGTRTFPR